MTRTIYYTATTLDGFIADPDDSLDWLLRQPQGETGPQDETWPQGEAGSQGETDPHGEVGPKGETQNQGVEQRREDPGDYESFIAGVGAMVMGSTTYEWVLRHESGVWPYRMPTWVMTHRELTMPTNANDENRLGIRLAQGNVTEVHAEMREAVAGKDIWVVGGGDLAGQFAEAGLLDEVVTSIAPVTLGAGRPLLPRRLDLELLETGKNGAFLTARHRVVGPLAEDRA